MRKAVAALRGFLVPIATRTARQEYRNSLSTASTA